MVSRKLFANLLSFIFVVSSMPLFAQSFSVQGSLNNTSGTEVVVENCYAPLDSILGFDKDAKDLTVACWGNELPHDASDSAKFAYENRVCQCLKSSKNEAVLALMNSFKKNDSSKILPIGAANKSKTFAKVNLKLKQYRKKMDAIRNGLGFQASLLTGDSDFIKIYNNTSGDEANSMKNSLASDVKASASMSTPLASPSNSTTLSSLKENFSAHKSSESLPKSSGVDDLINDNIDSTFNKKFEINPDLINDGSREITAKGQCRSARQYFMGKQYPFMNSFSSIGEEFNEDGWNFDKLKQRFKYLVANKDPKTKEEVRSIREKIVFLSRNPMIKNFLSASSNYDQYFKEANVNDEDKTAIQASVKQLSENDGLKQKKAALFSIIKNLSKTCSSGNFGTCFKEAKKNGKMAEYDSQLEEFFTDPDVGVLTKAEAGKEVFQTLSDFKRDLHTSVAPHDSYANFQDHLATTTGASVEVNCRGEVDLEKCVSDYSELCYRLGPVLEKRKKLQRDLNPEFDDNLEELLADNFNTDINENKDFKRYNDLMCSTPRFKDENCQKNCSLSFNDWRKGRCQNSKIQYCDNSVASFDELYKQFKAEYPVFKGVNKDEVAALLEMRPPTLASGVDKVLRTGSSFSEVRSVLANKVATRSIPSEGTTSKISEFDGAGSYNRNEAAGSTALAEPPMFNPINSSAMINNSSTEANSLPRTGEKLNDESKARIRAAAQAEVEKSKQELKTLKDSTEKAKLEQRMKHLEELLAQKTNSEQKYQKLLEELNNKVKNQVAPVNEQKMAGRNEPVSNNWSSANSDGEQTDWNNRAPASIGESKANGSPTKVFVPGTTASKFVSSSSASGSKASSGANSALLDAAIARGKASNDGAAIIIKELDKATHTAVENTINPSAGQLALSVPANVYAQIQSENVEVLRKYNEEIIKNVQENQTVRLVVKNGDQSLKILVMNRNGNLVYMPSRVFSLKSLNQHLGPARLPSSEKNP